jgi:hypothetical protein
VPESQRVWLMMEFEGSDVVGVFRWKSRREEEQENESCSFLSSWLRWSVPFHGGRCQGPGGKAARTASVPRF